MDSKVFPPSFDLIIGTPAVYTLFLSLGCTRTCAKHHQAFADIAHSEEIDSVVDNDESAAAVPRLEIGGLHPQSVDEQTIGELHSQ